MKSAYSMIKESASVVIKNISNDVYKIIKNRYGKSDCYVNSNIVIDYLNEHDGVYLLDNQYSIIAQSKVK